ncbi:MAG: phenylacetate--CoA ligase family protein, partial [Burkholderiales bacterium]
SMTMLNYFDAADPATIRRDYPLGEAFLDRFRGMSRDALRDLQDRRFRQVMAFAWRVPFYRRLWTAAGLEPGDVRGLEDIGKLPTYSKSDLMASVQAHPPLGDFHGADAHPPDARPQIIIQTTSGTTGMPQPLLYGPRSREIQNALLARAYLLQGMRAEDVVHSVYGFGMVNGGHYVRETVVHWVGAQLLSAGTGAETRSVQQVALMRDLGATVLVGFGDFLRRLAEVAREQGIEPGRDIRLRMVTGHLGPEGSAPISEAWGGCAVYDWYGVGDTGIIAGEGPDQSGMYVMEDAQYLELVDPDSGAAVEPGTPGNMVNTCLFKDDVFPIIRFNTNDVTEEIAGESPLGLPLRRILGFRGRSDNMVKLRGVNVYPTAIGAVLAAERSEFRGEFLCQVERAGNRDQMTVFVEVHGERSDALRQAYEALLRTRLGVDIGVSLKQPGELAERTGVESRQKPVRLIDRRGS